MAREKENKLKKPSLFRRVWKIWLYNIILTAIFFGLFWGYYDLDTLAFELDFFSYASCSLTKAIVSSNFS